MCHCTDNVNQKLFNEFLIAHLKILKEKSHELLIARPRSVLLLVFYPLIDLSTQSFISNFVMAVVRVEANEVIY